MLNLDCKIFITGSTGFIGSYILRQLLAEGYENITCLKRSSSNELLLGPEKDKVRWVEGDILDLPFLMDALADIECIIHAAAMVSYDPNKTEKILMTSVDGTSNLVNIALDSKVKKFIYISSISAIGRKKPVEHINEMMMFSQSKYDTTYGLSKFLGEQEVWRGHAEGLNVTILNPSTVLGPGKWMNSSSKIFTRLYKGMNYFPIGSTGFVDVRDVAEAAILSLNEIHNGERFIISAENWSYEKLFNNIAEKLNVKRPNKPLSPYIAGIVWRIESILSFFTKKSPIITRERALSTSVNSTYDHAKSVNKLGMNYRDINQSILETSQKFIETYPAGKEYATF
jgi:nucleoside-diphosphate-sugar epimerase